MLKMSKLWYLYAYMYIYIREKLFFDYMLFSSYIEALIFVPGESSLHLALFSTPKIGLEIFDYLVSQCSTNINAKVLLSF